MKIQSIICIGDSNTWGYDPRSFFGSRYPADIRWTGILEGAGWRVCNLGQNGMSVPGERELPMFRELILKRLPADLLTVMMGSNDLLDGTSAEETAERMGRFLACVTEAAPESRVILIAPPVMRPGSWVRSRRTIEESARLPELYRKLAAERKTAFADAEEWNVEPVFDGVHFSPEGHRAFAEGLMRMTDSL